MATDEEIEQAHRAGTQGQPSGGGGTRGPDNLGGDVELSGDPQPNEGRTTGAGGAPEAGADKAFDASNAPAPGPGYSSAEGVAADDTSAASPLGVGVSTTKRGEDFSQSEPEEGRERVGTKGESDRPVGTSTAENATGVDPQDSGGDSPNMPPA